MQSSLARHDREIGTVVAVNSTRVVVQIHDDLTSPVHSYPGGQVTIAQIGAYCLFPAGAGESVVGVLVGAYENQGYEPDPHKDMTLQLIRPRRTLHFNLVGAVDEEGKFQHGISVFPTLSSPALVPSRQQIETIFSDFSRSQPETLSLHIGSSPIYDSVQVAVSLDDLFSRPLALVGNTGSGKSWSVASLIHSTTDLLDNHPDEFSPKFIVLDINGEYSAAFDEPQVDRQPHQVYIGSEAFSLPLWLFDFREMAHYFGAAGTQVQAPVLERMICLAREDTWDRVASEEREEDISALRAEVRNARMAKCFLEALVRAARTAGGDYVGQKVRDAYNSLTEALEFGSTAAGLWQELDEAARHRELQTRETLNTECFPDAPLPRFRDNAHYNQIPSELRELVEELALNLMPLLHRLLVRLERRADLPTITADAPYPFSPNDLDRADLVDLAVASAESEGRTREYVATLRLRIRRLLADKRHVVFTDDQGASLREMIERLTGNSSEPEDVVVVDCSMLAHDVLPFFCAVLGRILLDVRQNAAPEQRTSRPWILVLEEAHNYIRPKREMEEAGVALARDTFERISKEGRKFGLSLAMVSQRPSDISETALSQCANFIVHRIQNPRDIDYFRRILPAGSRDVLDQVAILRPGEALLVGSATNVPCRTTVWRPSPAPHSETPRPSVHWRHTDDVPDFDLGLALRNWSVQEPKGDREVEVEETLSEEDGQKC